MKWEVVCWGAVVIVWLLDLQLHMQSAPITMLWVRFPLRGGVPDTTLCDKSCQWLAAGPWFSPRTPVSATNKLDCHDITEILLKVVLNTITQTPLWLFILFIAVELLTINIWTFYNLPCLQLLRKGSHFIFRYIVRHSCMISNNIHMTYILTFFLCKCICLTDNHINNVQQNNRSIL